jgi:hypothetical protein
LTREIDERFAVQVESHKNHNPFVNKVLPLVAMLASSVETVNHRNRLPPIDPRCMRRYYSGV